jgi:hypothetical protein
MKSITEFPVHKLQQGLTAKTALTTEGKTAEEVSTAIGEQFKMEGDKIKHFLAACDVAGQNADKLMRVKVIQLADGETAPPKAIKIEDHHYIPEFQVPPKAPLMTRTDPKGGPKKGGPKPSGPKESPWGLSPEQKAAKKAGQKAGANKPS